MWLDFTNKDYLEFNISNKKSKKSYDLSFFISNKDKVLDTVKAIGFNVYNDSMILYVDMAELELQLKHLYMEETTSTATIEQLKVINVSFGVKYFLGIPEIRQSINKACESKYVIDMGKYAREKEVLGAKYKTALRQFSNEAYSSVSTIANRAVGEAYLAFKELPVPEKGHMRPFNSYTVKFFDVAVDRIDESLVQFHYLNCGTEEAAKYFRTSEKILDFKASKTKEYEAKIEIIKPDVFESHGFHIDKTPPVDKLVDMEAKARNDFWFPEGVR